MSARSTAVWARLSSMLSLCLSLLMAQISTRLSNPGTRGHGGYDGKFFF